MQRFAVSYIDWFDHDLTTLIVSAADWREALLMHPKIASFEAWPTDSLENCKRMAFDCDCMVECIVIPDAGHANAT